MEESLKRQQSMFLILVLGPLIFLIEEIWGVGYPNRCAPPSPKPPLLFCAETTLTNFWFSCYLVSLGVRNYFFPRTLLVPINVRNVSTMMLYRSTLVNPFTTSTIQCRTIYLFIYFWTLYVENKIFNDILVHY